MASNLLMKKHLKWPAWAWARVMTALGKLESDLFKAVNVCWKRCSYLQHVQWHCSWLVLGEFEPMRKVTFPATSISWIAGAREGQRRTLAAKIRGLPCKPCLKATLAHAIWHKWRLNGLAQHYQGYIKMQKLGHYPFLNLFPELSFAGRYSKGMHCAQGIRLGPRQGQKIGK